MKIPQKTLPSLVRYIDLRPFTSAVFAPYRQEPQPKLQRTWERITRVALDFETLNHKANGWSIL